MDKGKLLLLHFVVSPIMSYSVLPQLAALQYQAYFLDRIEPKSVIAFCK